MYLKGIQIPFRQVGEYVMQNSPSLLAILAVSGVATTTILGVSATGKAIRIIDYERDIREGESINAAHGLMPEPLTRTEIVKLVWKLYVPTMGMGLLTVGCILGSNAIHLRRNAALASLYSLADIAIREYQSKVLETIGEKKEGLLRESISQDRLTGQPVDEKAIILTGKGETLCFESLSGRYFKSDIETIRRCVNDFNFRLNSGKFQRLNDFYDDLGLEPTSMGYDVGWISHINPLNIQFDTKQATDGVPCLVLNYRHAPLPL